MTSLAEGAFEWKLSEGFEWKLDDANDVFAGVEGFGDFIRKLEDS